MWLLWISACSYCGYDVLFDCSFNVNCRARSTPQNSRSNFVNILEPIGFKKLKNFFEESQTSRTCRLLQTLEEPRPEYRIHVQLDGTKRLLGNTLGFTLLMLGQCGHSTIGSLYNKSIVLSLRLITRRTSMLLGRVTLHLLGHDITYILSSKCVRKILWESTEVICIGRFSVYFMFKLCNALGQITNCSSRSTSFLILTHALTLVRLLRRATLHFLGHRLNLR
jgi:hypothetical protein